METGYFYFKKLYSKPFATAKQPQDGTKFKKEMSLAAKNTEVYTLFKRA